MTSIMSGMFLVERNAPICRSWTTKVYVNSFLTKIAKGMTVTNNLSDDYLSYIEKMDEDLYYAVQYGYGTTLSDNLFTASPPAYPRTRQSSSICL